VTLAAGVKLGPYEIVAPLGAGGMGEVYRAKDTKLGREVAIKVLPEALAEDAERLARFQREAQVLASLNHPHIAAIYGLERSGNVEALVLELVDGETLAERIGAGPIPVDEALAIARQIADALEGAHEKGIVHRDLKPANVKVTTEGKVKVLDFGLAKALTGDASSPDVSHSPTLTAQATQAGVVIGTAAYMSPEQARGKAVDKRADIWAFGAVLYEMLAGRKAFEGETVSDTLAAVLRADIDWASLPDQTPPGVRGVLRRCLDRDPKHRLRDIGDARIALEDLTPGADGSAAAVGGGTQRVPIRRRTWAWLAAVLAALLAGMASGRFAMAPHSPPARPVRFEISAGRVSSVAISPDGRLLAIASGGKVRVRDLARLEIREVEGSDGGIRPFWSPDSRTIVFGARGKLWKVLAEGGAPSAICELDSGLWDDDAGGAWLSDGTIVFSNGNSGLWQVSAQGGDPVEVLKPDPKQELDFHTVGGLPDGRSVIYVIHRAGEGGGPDTLGIWSGGKARRVFESKGQVLDDPTFSPSGHILFARMPTNAGVWALPFSLKGLSAAGEPFLVSPESRGPSVASEGTLVVLPRRRGRARNLTWVDRSGKTLGHVDEPRVRGLASISPDGNRIAAAEITDGKSDIWLYDLERGTRSRLTSEGAAVSPVWLKDGRSILYENRNPRTESIRRVLTDGSARVEDVAAGVGRPGVSRDELLFYSVRGGDGWRLWYRSLKDAKQKPALFLDQPFYSIDASPSPDGRFVAYEAWSGPNASEIFLRRFPPSEGVWQVSANGGSSPRWSSDGRLFFAQGADILEVALTTEPEMRLGSPTRLFRRTAPSEGGYVVPDFDVSPDGKRFLIYEPAGETTEERIVVELNGLARLRPGAGGETSK
jgi:Tol biopolymer transport system component